MIYQTPDGVLPSFALAAASQALQVEPVLGPDRIEIAGQLESNGPRLSHAGALLWARGKLQAHQRSPGPPRRPRSGSAARQSRRRRRDGDGRGSDAFATPFDRVAPGAEVFATAIGNLLAGDGLARTPSTRRVDAAAAVALPVVMIALMAMRRAAIGLVLASLVFVLWLAGIFLAFVHGYWLSVAAPLASALPLTVGFAAARSIVERRAGTRIAAEKSTLSRFHSPLLLDHLSREPDFLEKPVRQDVAVMFLDLSGIDRRSGGAWTRRDARPFQRDADPRRGRGDRAWGRRHQLHGRRGSRGVRFAEAAKR